MRKLKIILPAASLHLGGGCRVIAETANGLTRKGHDVEVVIPNGQPIDYRLECKIKRIPRMEAQFIPAGDVILPNYYTTVIPAFQSSPTKSIRLSLGFEPLWSNDKETTMDTYLLPIPIASISRWHHDEILRQTGKESQVVNPGLDFSVFSPADYPKSPNPIPKILFLARDPKLNYGFKGAQDFAEAMRIVHTMAHIPFEIQLQCPEGDHQLEGLPVTIFGRTDDNGMAERYRKSDLFISASWFESFGYPVLEAMACGTSVVTTDSGGVRDFAADRETCWVVPPRKPQVLAKAIIQALDPQNAAKRMEMKKLALLKARQFTWERYISQLESVIREHTETNPIQIKPEYTDNIQVRNFELGTLLAKWEVWPHGIDLPANIPFSALIKQGAEHFRNNRNSLSVCSVNDVAAAIMNAMRHGAGFSSISLGDTECAFLGIEQDVAEPYISLPEEGFSNAGYSFEPNMKQKQQEELLNAVVLSNMVGIPLFRHGLISRPLLDCLARKGIDLSRVAWTDSTVSYQMMKNGVFKRLLLEGNPRVLCIGNESKRLHEFLKGQHVRTVGYISPVNGFKDWRRAAAAAALLPHDIALVAAGAASIPICTELATKHHKIALDIGKVADEWVTGITAFSGDRNYDNLLTCSAFSDHQKRFCLEFQSGYQQGLNELICAEQSYPLDSYPWHWIKFAATRSTPADTICSPIWLKSQLRKAERENAPLSVVMFDRRKITVLDAPGYGSIEEIRNCASSIDIIGVPYLTASAAASIETLQPIRPGKGWVDETALKQLQVDYYGRFLPYWLKTKKLLIVMKDPRRVGAFLQSKGYQVWGAIDTRAGREQVLNEMSRVKKFEVGLVSSGIETVIYSRFIAREMGKIALDFGEILHDALRGGINRIFWTNTPIRKMD